MPLTTVSETFGILLALLIGCTPKPVPPPPPLATPKPAARLPLETTAERKAINVMLDDWHDAATKADEARYFGHFTPGAVFMGTDATERWDMPAFRAYAHPHFAKGKAWSFKATRRAIMFAEDGATAWFDEDLATPNLGPARGTGVVQRGRDRPGSSSEWRIAHYNLTITVPNERFKDVRALLEGACPCAPAPASPQ